MSEQPTAKPAAKPSPGKAPASGNTPGKKDNVFTHKIGPLPMIAWVAIIGIGLVIWRMVAAKKSAEASNTGAASTAAGTVPQFVNQTYSTVVAPQAPDDDDHRRHRDEDHDKHRKHAASHRPSRHHPDQDHDDDQDHDKDHDKDHGGDQDRDKDQVHGGRGDGHQRNQDKEHDNGWRSNFTQGDMGGHDRQESQRSGRGRGRRGH